LSFYLLLYLTVSQVTSS